EGDYDFEAWMQAVRGLEKEPEKGARCEVCFDKRFDVSAKKALELGENKITTTLLVSPLKSQEQLKRSGNAFYEKYGVEFIAVDYRSGGGTQDQSRVTKDEQLYRQDYCGCLYGLTMQREQQNRLMDEMFSSISGAILPASIEERLEFYKHRMDLEDKGVKYKIIKQKFLNYRQLSSRLIKGKKEVIPSYTLAYSILAREKTQGRIEFEHDNVFYLNKDEIKLITLDFYNKIASTNYKNTFEMIFSEENFENELKIRNLILNNTNNSLMDLSPVIIVDYIPDAKITLELNAKIYEDTKEKLIIL
ncbi:MAG: epoxyqueuosine reductase QueH, partial [Thiovulaceae bacterium]|nr:epoxyqueuosine reductase QueH [Sulfurimonadaceae bacterium]